MDKRYVSIIFIMIKLAILLLYRIREAVYLRAHYARFAIRRLRARYCLNCGVVSLKQTLGKQ
jgi:hypothetical protein